MNVSLTFSWLLLLLLLLLLALLFCLFLFKAIARTLVSAVELKRVIVCVSVFSLALSVCLSLVPLSPHTHKMTFAQQYQ